MRTLSHNRSSFKVGIIILAVYEKNPENPDCQ